MGSSVPVAIIDFYNIRNSECDSAEYFPASVCGNHYRYHKWKLVLGQG